MAKWLSKRPELHGELYHVRGLLWETLRQNTELRERVSTLSQEIQAIGLDLDKALKLIDEGV